MDLQEEPSGVARTGRHAAVPHVGDEEADVARARALLDSLGWVDADGDGTADDPGHQVKDIRSGEQSGADPGTWTPPAQDLRPHVVSTHALTSESPEGEPR